MRREAEGVHALANEGATTDALEESLDNVAPPTDSSGIDEGAMDTVSDAVHDTWDPPEYHVDLVQTRYTQYTEESRTTGKDTGGPSSR